MTLFFYKCTRQIKKKYIYIQKENRKLLRLSSFLLYIGTVTHK